MAFDFQCPLPSERSDRVLMAHGGGGRLSRRLIKDVFRKHLRSPELARDHDGAVLEIAGAGWAFTTDSYVITPPFFPGGDIGSLAVHGTVNDLAACGARARWISAGFILEEGFLLSDLKRVVQSMAQAAQGAGVELVTGDTKVVERGHGDGIFITTAGLGQVLHEPAPCPQNVRPGDRVLVSGPIGLHGMAILSIREGLAFEADLASDSAPLGGLVEALYAAGVRPHCLRDPTRGGVAAALAEIAETSRTCVALDEEAVPVPETVKGACEILGLDPLFVANEGKMLVIVSEEDEALALETMRRHPLGAQAASIGAITAESPGSVLVRTALGSLHLLDIPAGEELPRIC